MPSSDTHIIIGAGVGIGTHLLNKLFRQEPITLNGIAKAGLAGSIIGLLPDLIEPATNPNHRKFFHSAIMTGGLLLLTQNPDLKHNPITKEAIEIAGYSYLSHLLLDSFTPKGLPLY